MKVSLNTVKQYTDVNVSVDELVAKINAQLGGVEEVVDLGKRYDGATIAKVVSCKKHDNADKLSVCEIDAGTGETIQVVCGAPNVREGLYVVWLKPGSTVPATFDDKEPFVLEARELRGVMSHGMLASAKEIGLGDDHSGIVEITESDLKEGKALEAGASFAETFDLDDTIIDIENKMFTHRPDLFGQLGVAREISAILKGLKRDDEESADTRYENPEWYWLQGPFEQADGLELTVENSAPEKVPRFMAVAMNNVTIAPSPLWLQTTLVRWGAKPINNVVDLTNYLMLLTAQPTHAYDYDKLRGQKLEARMAQAGETLTLLNGKTYELSTDDIVIADGDGPIGLGGIMGGGNSEVSADTQNIVLEVANFDMYSVRRSSMRHGIFTDALTRFNKGQSYLQNHRIMNELLQLITATCGGEQASVVYDELAEGIDGYAESYCKQLRVTATFANERLGLSLAPGEMGDLLRRTNFASYSPEDDENALLITAPFWRTDIAVAEDIVEEVGRLYGFDKLPRELPQRSIAPTPKNAALVTKTEIRDSLRRMGANEVLTYSFVHEKVLTKASQDSSQAFRLSNALSPDLQFYRLSVLPSLLDKVHANIKAGHNEFTLYEIGKGHNKNELLDDGLPREINYVDAVYASKQPHNGAAFYAMRATVTQLATDLGLQLVFTPAFHDMTYQVSAPFEPSRSALIETSDGQFIGIVGELKSEVKRAFKLPVYTAAMSLDFDSLKTAHASTYRTYQPLSRYPSTRQDISLKVDSSLFYSQLSQTILQVLKKYSDFRTTLELLSIYQSQADKSTVTYTFRIGVVSDETTLTDSDMNALMDAVAAAAHDGHNAVHS